MAQENKENNGISDEEKILLPYTYLEKIPGNSKRMKMTSAFNYWLEIPDDKVHAVWDIMQTIHNSSLLLDDILDDSTLRRGYPVAHKIYGLASTLNAFYFCSFIVIKKTIELNHTQAINILIENLLETHRGQGIEIYWRDNVECPTVAQYKEMCIQKYGMFRLVIDLMQIFSENKTDYTKLCDTLGLYYQIRDDYCNLTSREYSDTKTYCEDLTEGKFSLPIIHAVNQEGGAAVLAPDILRLRTQDIKEKRRCVSLLEDLGSFEYTRVVLHELDKEVRDELSRLGGNPYIDVLLEELQTWRMGEHATDLDGHFI